jgi:hypothetical protein
MTGFFRKWVRARGAFAPGSGPSRDFAVVSPDSPQRRKVDAASLWLVRIEAFPMAEPATRRNYRNHPNYWAFAVHRISGGLRLLIIEFLAWRDWQKTVVALSGGASLAVGFVFSFNVF